jgi:hypothetical protein
MNRNRILIVLAGITILALVGLGLYLLLRKTGNAGDTSGNLPEIGGNFASLTPDTTDLQKSIVPLENISAYHASSDGTVVAIHRDGTISQSSDKIVSLSSVPVADFASASFSGDGRKILVLTGQQPRSQVNIFDVATASWRVIPGTFRDAVWAPSGSLLATLTPDTKTGKTVVALYDTALGKTTQTLTTLELGDVSVSWPAPKTIIIADKPTSRSTGSAWAIDTATKKVTLAARGKLGFTAVWNDTATAGIAFQANTFGGGGVLKLLEGSIEKAKLAFVTIPTKCSFTGIPGAGSSTTPYVICAIPKDQDAFQKTELPDSWYRKQIYTEDVLVGINLSTSEVDFSISPPAVVDATQMQIVGSTIYYVDRASGQLYKSDISS